MNTPRSECASQVLKCADEHRVSSLRSYIRALCEVEARKAAEKMWDSCNPDDVLGGPFSGNPYQESPRERENVERLREESERAQDVFEFASQQICLLLDGIDKEYVASGKREN